MLSWITLHTEEIPLAFPKYNPYPWKMRVSCSRSPNREETRRAMLRHRDTQSQRMSLCVSSAFTTGVKIYFPCQNHCPPLPMPLPSIPEPVQAPSSKSLLCQGGVHLGMEDLTPQELHKAHDLNQLISNIPKDISNTTKCPCLGI